MIDLARIEGFDWDEGNSRKSAEKHGIGQAEAEQVFLNDRLLIIEDKDHSMLEPDSTLWELPQRTGSYTSLLRCAVMTQESG